jgi:carboxynorspermidine decarboxylase
LTAEASVGEAVGAVINGVETPAFIIDEGRIVEAIDVVKGVVADTGCHLLYALKAQASADALRVMRGRVGGFAASSLFEAELARSVLREEGSVHITTPGFRPDEMPYLNELCDYVSLNSLSQLDRFIPVLTKASTGLRVNPELSLVKDARFDPCRAHSKLGVPIRQLARVADSDPEALSGVAGIHLHSNCDSRSFEPLLKTVRRVSKKIDALLHQVSWVNLGGGYLFSRQANTEPLCEAIGLLSGRYGVEVFIEPGAALVREAGCLVSTVIDLARNGGETLAFLDTTVNHMPEVYEYQFEPDVVGHLDSGGFRHRLVGSTCLAGDAFGRYAFPAPLEIGSRVVFSGMGAYTMVKAHMFNGVNLPNIYSVTETGDLVLRKQFTYRDFASNCGEEADASL